MIGSSTKAYELSRYLISVESVLHAIHRLPFAPVLIVNHTIYRGGEAVQVLCGFFSSSAIKDMITPERRKIEDALFMVYEFECPEEEVSTIVGYSFL
ncbi:hypothetical protein PP175_28850 (plasmid) [Aneurinibacillus sp. Ricciae_BoGa-3]|uniref:hypothetical protein n=1 Tax=Aneurinibacillus sp. Ricciae_BoGa-3 TaxID=3022697 RepID=UPI00233F8C75|nr:hypothetical protein [Aneurinibacillus sp. Ricciae_BoGa-3]WCK57200.1 hypothetical protein PP175_28850 [Aneurinibacillus sp. Ricciae_BoGa-3]